MSQDRHDPPRAELAGDLLLPLLAFLIMGIAVSDAYANPAEQPPWVFWMVLAWMALCSVMIATTGIPRILRLRRQWQVRRQCRDV